MESTEATADDTNTRHLRLVNISAFLGPYGYNDLRMISFFSL